MFKFAKTFYIIIIINKLTNAERYKLIFKMQNNTIVDFKNIFNFVVVALI